MKKLVLILIIGMLSLAESALGFRLTPASLELEVKRGETQKQILRIGNSADKPIQCRLYPTGLEIKRDGKQLFEEASEKYSARGWLKPKETVFEVPAEGTKEVELDIAVPRNTKPGDYFATIMAESTAPGRAKTPQGVEIAIGVNFRLGCITRITVPGRTVRKKAEISEVKVQVPVPGPESEEPVKVIATLENKCEVHLDARGEALIKDSEGRVFDKFVLQGAGKDAKGQALVYPEGARDFWGVVQRPLPPGEYRAEVSFDYGYRFRKAKGETTFMVTPEFSEEQKGFLVMIVEPNPLELEMSPGAFRSTVFKVSNLDFEPLEVEVSSSDSWLKALPTRFIIPSGKSQTLRIDIYIPEKEPVKRVGKILFQPERGKPVTVDVVISEPKRKEGER